MTALRAVKVLRHIQCTVYKGVHAHSRVLSGKPGKTVSGVLKMRLKREKLSKETNNKLIKQTKIRYYLPEIVFYKFACKTCKLVQIYKHRL